MTTMAMTQQLPNRTPSGSDSAAAPITRQAQRLRAEVQKVIVGKADVIDRLIVSAMTESAHILFEDLPGLAKSVLAATFSKAVGCEFHRVQFTPDLLPTDITGGHIYNRSKNEFEFRKGPVFTNVLLADEINRASPKTQSALLEAMAEKQVSVEGITHRLPPPFLVLATQNPVEQEGTYPLPEAQMDRFAMRLSMGYPTRAEEAEILARRVARHQDSFEVQAVMRRDDLLGMQKTVETVHVDPAIIGYIATIIEATRKHADLAAGCSPRGSLALLKLARASAAIRGRMYVIPDDVKDYAVCTLAHRAIVATQARVRGVKAEQVIKDILQRTPVPRGLAA